MLTQPQGSYPHCHRQSERIYVLYCETQSIEVDLFVFVFLALMVVVTNLMSVLISKIQPEINLALSMNTESTVVIDEKTRAIIETAIKMHIKR